MYCACTDDQEKKVVAYHPDKKVIEKYILDIYKSHKINLKMIKIKNRYKNKIKFNEDLLLVRYRDFYIQIGYMVHYQIMSEDLAYDHQYARDILIRMVQVELDDDEKKEQKILMKAIDVLSSKIYDDNHYTPTLTELERSKELHEKYASYLNQLI